MDDTEISIGVNRICTLCGISKATYYNNKEPDELFKDRYNHLKDKIKKIIEKNSSYGIRRIKQALLDDFKETIGRDTLAKLLVLWGLSLKRNIKKRKRSMLQKILFALSDKVNLLIRTKINKPLQAISSDISTMVYNNGKSKCYLSIHKDVFGQMVYGYAIKELMEVEIVMESLEMAMKYLKGKIGKKFSKVLEKVIFHQDQGSQYTSYTYTARIMELGKLSYSTPGTPTENPGQESFFGRFKDEWREEIYEIEDFKKVKKFIEEKIKYYNKQRLHTSINYQTPYFFTKNSLKFW